MILVEIERLITKLYIDEALRQSRYLNDYNYFGGFDEEDLNQLFEAMQSNYEAWVSGFAPLAVGADVDCVAVQEFGRTLFNIRPDIAFSVAKTIFQSDLRNMIPHVHAIKTLFHQDCLLLFTHASRIPVVLSCIVAYNSYFLLQLVKGGVHPLRPG